MRERRPGGGERSVLGGSAALLGARYGQAVLGYVGSVVIARSLTEADYGGYTLVFGVLGIVGILCDVQASRLVLREVLDAEEGDGSAISSYMLLRFLVAVTVYALTVAGMAAAGYPDRVVVATAVGGTVIPLAATWSALRILFQARLWLRSLSAMTIAAQLVQVALTIVIAVSPRPSLVRFMAPAVAFNVVFLIVMVVIARRHVRLRLSIDRATWWRWIRDSAPIALGATIGEVYFRVDAVLLSRLDTLEAVGRYGIGYKFSDLIGFVASAIMASAFTLLVTAWPDHPAAFRRTANGVFVLLSVLGIGLAAGFVTFAEPAISLLYGSRFTPAADAARLLVVGRSLYFLTHLCFYLLLATGRHRVFPGAAAVGLAVNVGLNLVLIPRFSIAGAGWATIVTELVVLVVLARSVLAIPEVGEIPWGVLGRALLAGATLAVVGLGLEVVVPWPLAAAVAATTYGAIVHRWVVPGGIGALGSLLRQGGDEAHVAEVSADDPSFPV